MKYQTGFGNWYNVNFNHVLYPQKPINDFVDFVCKAFYSGFVTKFGKLMVFGIGAERGTYGRFANLLMENVGFKDAREALTYLTNIYSMAMRNNGVNNNLKKHYWLSQRQEINPVLSFFGLTNDFNQIWKDTEIHDNANNLKEEWIEKKKISNWKIRTKLTVMPFQTKELTIMNNVCLSLMTTDNVKLMQDNGIDNYTNFIQETFIEGTRGLTLTMDDIDALSNHKSIICRYRKAS